MRDARRTPAAWLQALRQSRRNEDPTSPTRAESNESFVEETLGRLAALEDVLNPDPRFLSQLERLLIEHHASVKSREVGPVTLPPSNGFVATLPNLARYPNRPATDAPSLRLRLLTTVATLALVVLAAVASFVAFRGWIGYRPHEAAPVVIPALAETPAATPPGSPSPASLDFALRGVINSLPGGATWTGIVRDFLEPGSEVTMQDGSPGESATSSTFLFVESGTLEVISDGPFDVLRAGAGGSATMVGAGTSAQLTAGDGVMFPPLVPIRVRNIGTERAAFINADLVPANPGPGAPGYYYRFLSSAYGLPVQVPSEVTLSQTRIAPEETLRKPTPNTVWLVGAKSSEESPYLNRKGEDYQNSGNTPLDVYVLTFTPKPVATPASPTTISSADGAFTATPLLNITLPAATLGRQSGATEPAISWIYSQYKIDAGKHLVYPDACSTPDFTVRYVVQGAYAAKALGPMRVIRHARSGQAATVEDIAPAQDVTLRAGDALVYHNLQADMFQGFRNPGPEPVELLEWEWLEDDCREALPDNMHLAWDAFPASANPALASMPVDASRPLSIRLRAIAATPGSDLPQDGPQGPGLLAPGFPGFDLAAGVQGHVSVSDTTPKETMQFAGSTMPPPGGMVSGSAYLPADATRTIRSAGDEPLRMYELTIVNTGDTALSPAGTPVNAEATPMD